MAHATGFSTEIRDAIICRRSVFKCDWHVKIKMKKWSFSVLRIKKKKNKIRKALEEIFSVAFVIGLVSGFSYLITMVIRH
jgi:hypothetical protein